MTQVKITKKYIDPKYPNLAFEVGEIYDAMLPIGGSIKSATIQRTLPTPMGMYNVKANNVNIEVPKEFFEVQSLTFLPIEKSSEQISSSQPTTKSDKSTKYIILGIAIIGFVSYLATKKSKK